MLLPGKLYCLNLLSPGKSGDDFVQSSHIQYSSRKWLAYAQYAYVGKNYTAEVGYVPRKNFIKLNPQLARYFFPKGGSILSHGPQLIMNYFFDTKFHETDHENIFSWLITFRSRATLSVLGQNDYVRLLQPFDPTNAGKDSLPAGSEYHYNLSRL
jgi:hypothetical protein